MTHSKQEHINNNGDFLGSLEAKSLVPAGAGSKPRKGTNGVSTNGVTANVIFFDRGTFLVLPLTYFYLPKSARAYLFPQFVKNITFAAAPLVLTSFARNQSKSEGAQPEKTPRFCPARELERSGRLASSGCF